MGNSCNACDCNEENKAKELKLSKPTTLKLHSNMNEVSNPQGKRQKLFSENIHDSDIKSTHKPENAEKVNEMNKISEFAIKVEDEKGNFKVRYINDNINNGAPVLGPYKYENDATYLGQFFNGMKHGKGRIVYLDGTVYEGQWINDNRHGKGRVIYPLGDYYEGNS